MRWCLCLFVLLTDLLADECRARVDGVGCRTRQLAVQRIWERLPEVDGVTVLPRDQRQKPNQRDFVLRCSGKTPTTKRLNEALGRRTSYYRAIQILPTKGSD